VKAVTTDWGWVAAHGIDSDVRLVELDVSPAAYQGGHVPGAVFWNAYTDLRGPDYLPVGPDKFRVLLEQSGIGPQTTVVFYGYAGALGHWLMQANGHSNSMFLDGPRDPWVATGGNWEVEAPVVQPRPYRDVTQDSRLLATREEMARAIEAPRTLILDVRSPEEFAGQKFWPSGATADVGRVGHMPGAVNVPIDGIRRPDGALSDSDLMKKVFDEAGVAGAERVITYCTIGNRASQAWVALTRDYGHPNAAVYYGSWVEWGKRPDSSIEA
jgi:thiosulfate/3-mercaptopyruvate sulfurtransferase